jgi:hypothetical protein
MRIRPKHRAKLKEYAVYTVLAGLLAFQVYQWKEYSEFKQDTINVVRQIVNELIARSVH